MTQQPETYQFRRRRDLFASSGSTSSNSTPSTANKSMDPGTTYSSPPRRARNLMVEEKEKEKAAVMKSPESYHFQRMYMAEGPKKKKNLTFAEPWKSPPESFSMKRGYRPEHATTHRRNVENNIKTKPEQPESYQFRRVYRYHMTEQSTETKKQRQQEEEEETRRLESQRDFYQPLPIESYRFTRLLIPREKVSFSKETAEEQFVRRAKETTMRWDEIEDSHYYVPPESYRMNTSYFRAEPKGTFKDNRVVSSTSNNQATYHDDHQRTRSASSSSSSSTPQRHRQRTTCSCLFFAYHGYCHGNHEAETRKYYNIDPESAFGDTIAWREYPNHSNNSNNNNSTQPAYHSSNNNNKDGYLRNTAPSSSSSGATKRDKVTYTKITTANHQLAETIGPMLLSIEQRVVGAEAEAAERRGGNNAPGISRNIRSSSAGRSSHRRGNRVDERLRERFRRACGYGGNKTGGGLGVRTESVAPKMAWDDDYSVCVRGYNGRHDREEDYTALLHAEEDTDGLVYDDYDDDDDY